MKKALICNTAISLVGSSTLLFLVLIFSGCGKNEASAGMVGTASGAVIGSSVSGKKNKGTGTVLGALIVNYLGRQVGKEADRQEVKEKQEKEHKNEEIRRLAEENGELRKSIEKWCSNCSRRVSVVGANTCPFCGYELILEKFCRRCGASFAPQSSYRYCPYCKSDHGKGVILSYR